MGNKQSGSQGTRAYCEDWSLPTVWWNNWAVALPGSVDCDGHGTTVLLVQAVNPEFIASPVVDIHGSCRRTNAVCGNDASGAALRDEMPA